MKKFSLYMMALLSAVLVGCSKDNYDPEAGPQTYYPESPLSVSDVSVNRSSEPTTINIAEWLDEASLAETPIPIGVASVREGAMPANTILKAQVEFSRDADFAEKITLDANSLAETDVISIQPGELQNAYFDNITKNPATTELYVRTILYTVTKGEAVAIIGQPGDNYFDSHSVTFTPLNKLTIAPAYYIIGGPNDWQASAINRTIKFNHSDEDVYVDPVFTVTFDAAAGDTWFAIGDDVACDAIAAGDWNQLYGIVGGDNNATSGKLARRTELGSDNSFCVPAGAKKIRVTIDMMESTFTVEAVSIAENYYLIGGPNGEWNSEKNKKFSHSDKDVFEDPVFTYVFEGNGGSGDIWFAFGDDDAMDAVGAGDWMQLFGYVGTDMELSGSYERRNILGGEYTFHVDGKAKFYRFTINALDKTYSITPLDFDPYIYFIGATDGWANAEQRLALTNESGIYTGYLYCADPNGWGNEFKFQRVAGDWGTEINTGMMTGGINGDFGDGGGNFKATAGEGVYFVTLDMANMSITGTKIDYMGVTGDYCGWNEGAEMTWNATDFCYEVSGIAVNANGWKFRANGPTDPNWTINLGGELDNLWADGPNLSTVGTTIKLYPTRRDKDNIYCTVE